MTLRFRVPVLLLALALALALGTACSDSTAPPDNDPEPDPDPDPSATVFSDDFEDGIDAAWVRGGEPGKYTITTDADLVASGSGALDITITHDWRSGQMNVVWDDEHDEVWIAADVMFSDGFSQAGVSSGHFMQVAGGTRADPFAALGKAGIKPTLDDPFFRSDLGPFRPDNRWSLGVVWPQMSGSTPTAYGDFPAVIGGDVFIEPGQYQRILWQITLNSEPGVADGRQRIWIDGVLRFDQQNVLWRQTEEVQINLFGWQAYYSGIQGTHHIYVDNVLIQTEPLPE